MTTGRGVPPARVPTLTEVVTLPEAAAPAPEAEPAPPPLPEPPQVPPFLERRANWPPIQEDQIVQRVLSDLQRQIDLMLETRMRETLTPALNRATDALVRDLRHELASTLRDVIAQAVAQELARHRKGEPMR
jgi:hypothetical protein